MDILEGTFESDMLVTAVGQPGSSFVTNDSALEGVALGLVAAHAHRRCIEGELADLEGAGLINATLVPEYREGENGQRWGPYYRLVYPTMASADRRREYVGMRHGRIEAARAAIARYRLSQALRQELFQLDRELEHVASYLASCQRILERRAWLRRPEQV